MHPCTHTRSQVPILRVGNDDLVLAESAPVSAYLLDTYGGAATVAPDFHAQLTPEDRARTAIFLDQVRGQG